MAYRILYRPDMSAADQDAFQTWASEQYEWGEREHDARARNREAAIMSHSDDDSTATVTVAHRRAA